MLTRTEEHALIAAARSGDAAAGRRLAEAYAFLVGPLLDLRHRMLADMAPHAAGPFLAARAGIAARCLADMATAAPHVRMDDSPLLPHFRAAITRTAADAAKTISLFGTLV